MSATKTTITFPNTLTNGNTADASEVMANLNAVATAINTTALGTDNLKDNAVTTAKITDGEVTTAKLDDEAVTTAKIADLNVTLGKLAAAVQAALVPAGSILSYGGTTAPTGFLMCDGTAVSRTTYSALFTAVGTAFGEGDGSTTFHVPDLRGRFLRGVDDATGVDPDAASRTAMNTGGNTGDAVGSIQADELKAHNHDSNKAASENPANSATLTGPTGSGTISVSSTGGDETRPKNAAVNFIIKT